MTRLVKLRFAAFLVPGMMCAVEVAAQTPPPGRAHLFVLDLSGTPVGEFPTTIKQRQGSMEVVIKDGMPMLKASVTSEFVITLPPGEVLPADFTLEFDLVPKPCCNPRISPSRGPTPSTRAPAPPTSSGTPTATWPSSVGEA